MSLPRMSDVICGRGGEFARPPSRRLQRRAARSSGDLSLPLDGRARRLKSFLSPVVSISPVVSRLVSRGGGGGRRYNRNGARLSHLRVLDRSAVANRKGMKTWRAPARMSRRSRGHGLAGAQVLSGEEGHGRFETVFQET